MLEHCTPSKNSTILIILLMILSFTIFSVIFLDDIAALRREMVDNKKNIAILFEEFCGAATDTQCQKAWDEGWRPRGYWRTKKRSARKTRRSSGT